MRLAIVSQEYPPQTAKGGIGSQAYAKAHGLARLGHDVTVISRSLTFAREEKNDDGVRVIRVRPHLDAYTDIADWIAYSAEVAAEIADIHHRGPFDLVEFPEWACEGYVHLLNRSEHFDVPTVIQLHGPAVMLAKTLGWPEPESEFHHRAMQLEQVCLLKADAIYSSSACSADWVESEYGLDRTRIPVMHSGVNTRHFTPRKVERDNRPTILFAGKVTWNKGVMTLLEAALKITPEFEGLRLRMLGRGDESTVVALRKIATQAGHEKLLELSGFIQRHDLPAEFSKADVFAAPSLYEGGPGFVYLEAMSCGLPAIACENSGAAEVVIPGENGALVPPDDVDALANALRKLLSDKAIGGRARDYVVANFDTADCVKRIEAFYKKVIA